VDDLTPEFFMKPAQEGTGQGVRVAARISRRTLWIGTVTAFALAVVLLRSNVLGPLLVAIAITAVCGVYFHRRLGGITGDCFGATNQITEIAIYLCGVIR
jgi:adenosylcobinamide-GDP ribazoletransferase